MNTLRKSWRDITASIGALLLVATPALAQQRPNNLVIMGDDVGWFNIGASHQGIMSGKTPNLDRLGAQQDSASFNLDAVKRKIVVSMKDDSK